MSKAPNLSFPKRFLWGASTSAHQVEGNTNNQWTEWEHEHAKSLAAQARYQYGDLETWDTIKDEATASDNYISGLAADHYQRYEADFDLLEKLHMNAFRFSIEWSRIEPKEGAWNVEALAHYKQYIAELKKRQIEPIVTLFHFTLPTWFAEKGGFEKRANIKYFVRFAQKMIEELSPHVKYVITINEPEVYAYESYLTGNWPPAVRSKRRFVAVTRNLIAAHNQTAKMIRGTGKRIKVSIAKNSVHVYPGDDAWLTLKSAGILQYLQDDYIVKRVAKQCDFLGVNYYMSSRVYGYRIHNADSRVSDLGWDMSPSDIQHVLERLNEKYNLPIIITENGVADGADEYRQWWITKTLVAMQKAMKNGVRLEGYLHWSLLDNVEWDKGKWPRFGLAAVDYTTQQRKLRPSAVWFGKILKFIRTTER